MFGTAGRPSTLTIGEGTSLQNNVIRSEGRWMPESGGTLSGNAAGCAGGGLFVQAGLSKEGGGGTPNYCIARISGGSITGNSMTNTGDSNSSFGGGGIYVNGYSSAYSAYHNGELYLSSVRCCVL